MVNVLFFLYLVLTEVAEHLCIGLDRETRRDRWTVEMESRGNQAQSRSCSL